MEFDKNRKIVNILLFLSYLVCFARLITLKHQIGLIGVGIFGAAFLLFYSFVLFMRFGFSNVLTRMINKRMTDGHLKNAGKLLTCGLILSVLISFIFVLIHLFLAGPISEGILHTNLCTDVIRFLAPAYLFAGVSETLSSYLAGSGDGKNDSLIKLICELMISILCFLFAGLFLSHGIKVGNLLKSNDYTSVFGARGCALGVTVGYLIAMVMNAFFYMQKKVNLKRLIRMDKTQGHYELSNGIRDIFWEGIGTFLFMLISSIIVIVSVSTTLGSGYIVKTAEDAPVFSSQIEAFGGVAAYIIPIIFVFGGSIYRIFQAYEFEWKNILRSEEIEVLRDCIRKKLRSYLLKALPVLGILFGISKPMIALLGCNNSEQYFGGVAMMFVACLFFGIYLLFSRYLIISGKKMIGYISSAVILVGFIIAIIISSSGNPTLIIPITFLITSIVLAIYSLVYTMISGMLNIRLVDVIKPVVSAAVCSALLSLISSLMFGKTPNLIIVILCTITFIIVYMILMSAIHGFTKRELSRIPFGSSLRRLFYNR